MRWRRRRENSVEVEDQGAASEGYEGLEQHHGQDEHGGHSERDGHDGAATRRGARRPLFGRWLSVFLLLVVLGGLAAQFITLPFVILRPGPAVDIIGKPEQGAPVVTVEGAKTYPTTGSLFFTTVAQYGGPGRRPSAWDVLAALLDPHSDLLRESVVYPRQVSEQQVREENTAAMTDSQQEAVAVALRALGKPVTEKAVVAQVVSGAPADGVLQKGDVITRVNDVMVARAPQISQTIQQSTGDVRITLSRGTQTKNVTLTPAEREGRRLVGVLVQPTFSYGVDVAIHAGDVGGPSAGMMFALGVYDTLTPGALTGGQRIAGTGTLDSTGRVGVIGGIAQKMEGAKESGAGYFLAPAGNCGEVVGHVPAGLVVTPVATFDEARAAVEKISAGQASSLPACPAG